MGQLVCNASQGQQNRLRHRLAVPCNYRGVGLNDIVAAWLQRRLELHGARQTRLLEEIQRHLHRVQPDALVLDEDATPMTRAAVAVAQRQGIASMVVEHGAPACRFGFSPLAADRVLTWGDAARQQFERWGVAGEQIVVTGSPYHDELWARLRRSAPSRKHRTPRILLLATVPPRDERPDALEVHLTRTTHEGMLEAAFAAVASLPEAELIVKLHPRSPEDPAVEATMGRFPQVSTQIVQIEPLEHWLGEVDCVLSCLSSAGIDATLAGVPVVQLMPAGCGDLLPAAEWGLLGSARTAEELKPLLLHALSQQPDRTAPPNPEVFSHAGQAAARVVQVALGHQADSNLSLPSPASGRREPRRLQSLIPNP